MLDPGEMARLGNRRVDCLTDTTRGDLNERGRTRAMSTGMECFGDRDH
jgi:hypothetical protein